MKPIHDANRLTHPRLRNLKWFGNKNLILTCSLDCLLNPIIHVRFPVTEPLMPVDHQQAASALDLFGNMVRRLRVSARRGIP